MASFVHFLQRLHCLLEHRGLDLPALPVEAIELLRAVRGARLVVGEQAFDAEAHVGEPARRVEARPGDEAEVEARRFAWCAARGAQQLHDPRLAVPGAQALQPLRHEVAVIRVERHHVGDGAERDEVGERTEIGLPLEGPSSPEFRAQGEHHVKHHADPRQRLGGKRAIHLIGVDDAGCVRQLGAGQVVVGDQRGDAEALRVRDALDARDAVVDGDQDVGLAVRGDVDQLGRQPVAQLEAVRHEIFDIGAEPAQRAHAYRARGRSVGIVVGDDQQALVPRDRVGEKLRRVLGVFQ